MVLKSSLEHSAKFPKIPILFAIVILIGIAIRLALALGTYGTNDLISWEGFAAEVETSGLGNLYRNNPLFNHPPLMGFLAVLLLKGSQVFDVPFHMLFKIIMVAAECGIMALLFRVWSRYSGAPVGWQVGALYSINLLTILVSGYHGNTDTLYCLAALGALLFASEKKPFYSGLTLAAAMNVKLIPLILVMPLLLSFTSWRDIKFWIYGFMVGLSPFIVAALIIGAPFINNVFNYIPVVDNWGIMFILRYFRHFESEYRPLFDSAIGWYMSYGRWVILGLITAISLWNRSSSRFSTHQLLGISSAIFLVFASGFGLQYFALLITMVFAMDPRWGLRLSAATGVTALFVYAHWLVSLNPAFSNMHRAPMWIAVVYLIAWGFILIFLVKALLYPQQKSDEILQNN